MQLTEMFGGPNPRIDDTRSDVDAIAQRICATANLDVSLKVADGDLYMTVSLLRLPKEDRKKGYGSAIMKELCAYADTKGIIVALSPTSEFGTGKATLVRFYKSFGFVPNSGRNKSYIVRDTMIRYPKTKGSIFASVTEAKLKIFTTFSTQLAT